MRVTEIEPLIKGLVLALALLPASLRAQQEMKVHAGATLQVADTQVAFYGDLSNEGTFSSSGGVVKLVGSEEQRVRGTVPITTHTLEINNPKHVRVRTQLEVQSLLTFTEGRILTDRAQEDQFIHFLDGANYRGADNLHFVDGVVRKTGNEAFTFPIGEGVDKQGATISAPANETDHFTAWYNFKNPSGDGYDTKVYDSEDSCGVRDVSEKEYWIVNRTGGTSKVSVSLEYDKNSSTLISLDYLLTARWDKDTRKWVSEGNGGVTGTSREGTITTGTECGSQGSSRALSKFSPFTLASSNPEEPLPVELLEFRAQARDGQVLVHWVTATETDNHYFTVERSLRGVMFVPIGKQAGAGSSKAKLAYTMTDLSPLSGVSYYRLKQTDFDGRFSYSPIVRVEVNGLVAGEVQVYPNPSSSGYVTISASEEELASLELYDKFGHRVYLLPDLSGGVALYDMGGMLPGVYFIRTRSTVLKVVVL